MLVGLQNSWQITNSKLTASSLLQPLWYMTFEYGKTDSWKSSFSPEDGVQNLGFHRKKRARIKSSTLRTPGGEDSTLQFIWHHHIVKSHTEIYSHAHTVLPLFQYTVVFFTVCLGVSWENSGLVKVSASDKKQQQFSAWISLWLNPLIILSLCEWRVCFLFNNSYPSPWIFFSLPFACLCCVGQSTALFLWETERAQNWSYFMLGLPRSQFSDLHVNFHTSVSYGECYGNFCEVLGRQFIHDPLLPPPSRLQPLPLQRISAFIINVDFKI